jgi:Zn-dependent protease
MQTMQKPAVVRPTDEVTTVGSVFGTPVVVKGRTWLPLTQVAVWLVMVWHAGRGHDDRSWGKRLLTGALTMAAILGSEWCHNLAHAAAARLVGKPMDALRVTWGMPLVVYHDLNDETVTPRQHIARALGGPLFNALLLPLALLLRKLTQHGSIPRDVADAAAGMNLFLSTASLLPIPGIDGGPVLKWALVARGSTPQAADETVQAVDRAVGGGLGAAAAVAFRKRRPFLGAILALFSLLSLAVGFGLIKEQE